MADLEQEKDLEEDEFKTNVKPSTSREMTTRICKKDVNYQFNEQDLNEDIDEYSEDEQNDDYSSPDIDYEAVANYEQNSTESTKNSTQNAANDTTEERKNDEDTMNYWNHQINEAFSEYNALWAKYGDKLEKQCKITRDKDTVEYFEETPKQVSNWIPNWPADKKMEKLLSFRDDRLNHLKRCLAIRGISN